MKHEMKARYPASPDVVIRMFTDRDFHTRKLEALGMTKYQVLAHDFDGQDFSIRIERKVPVEAPGMIRKVAPMETTVINEESWNLNSRTGRVNVEPQGMPLKMSCETSLAGDENGSVVTFMWDINASIPVVGATLEKFVIADMEKRAAEETQAAVALLKHYG